MIKKMAMDNINGMMEIFIKLYLIILGPMDKWGLRWIWNI